MDPWLNPVYPLGSTAGEGPFGAFTLGGTPQVGYVPAYTDASNLTWGPAGTGTVTVTGATPQEGDRVEFSGGTSIRAATGIQRITTNLPLQTEAIPQDTSIVYHLLINTNTAIGGSGIAVDFLGSRVGNLDNVDLTTTHLAEGENDFTFTLNDNQVRAWNANVNFDLLDFEGFLIRDLNDTNPLTNPINSIRDINQYFLGSANDDSTGVVQNHQDIVALQTSEALLQTRLTSLENEVHQLESSGRRVNTTFFREVSSIDTVTIDEITQYYRLADTGLTTPLTFGATVSGLVGENATFPAQRNTIGGDIICLLYTSPSPRDS